MLTERQLTERTKYIGSSDCAAVMGMSRWQTPLGVWGEKTGLLPALKTETLAMEVGKELEDLVCRLFTKRTGKLAAKSEDTIFHPNYSFIACNLDRIIIGEDAILEAKTCSGWKAKEWGGEDVPKEYVLQVMHDLAVTGKSRAYIAVLIGGNQDFRWKQVERDPSLINEIIKREIDFWIKFVEPKVMPTIITKDDAPLLAQLYPDGFETPELALGDDANRLVESRAALLEDKKALDGQIDQVDNSIKALMKEHAIAITDKYRIMLKNQVQERVDTAKLREDRPDICNKFSKIVKFRQLRVKALDGREDGK